MATYLESKADLSGNEFFFGCERDRISFLFSLFISLHFTIHYLSVCVHVCVHVYVYTHTCHSYTQLYIYSCCNSSSHSSHDNHMSHMAVIVTEGTWPTHRGFPCFCVSIVRAHGVHFYICPVCGHEFLVDV